MSTTSILLLDDDVEFRALLADELSDAGFILTLAGTVAEAEALVRHGLTQFEALLLDVGLPDGDGCDLCARLRAAGVCIPIVMLTGSDADSDVVRGLEAGANDYVAKPCSATVLTARLRVQLRLYESTMDAVFSLGPWRFHPAQKLLHGARNTKVRLTAREVDILRFMQRAGGVVSKRALLTGIWSYNPSVSSHTLETHIYRLRQKIEPDPNCPSLLLTAHSGYQLAST